MVTKIKIPAPTWNQTLVIEPAEVSFKLLLHLLEVVGCIFIMYL